MKKIILTGIKSQHASVASSIPVGIGRSGRRVVGLGNAQTGRISITLRVNDLDSYSMLPRSLSTIRLKSQLASTSTWNGQSPHELNPCTALLRYMAVLKHVATDSSPMTWVTFVCWLLNVPATCWCTSGTDLL